MERLDLTDPTALLLAVLSAFRQAGLAAAAYGGLALAAYGEPRETRDADLAVSGIGADEGARALTTAGLEVAIAFSGVRFGGNRVSRLTLLPGKRADGLNTADLVEPMSARFAGAVLGRAITATLRGQEIRIVTPEDFVLLKVLSTRDRDLDDAASLLRRLGPALDAGQVEEEVAGLAREIPEHDVAARWARVRPAR